VSDLRGLLGLAAILAVAFSFPTTGGRAGSFEAGVKGAQAGVAMPANPVPGLSYRQVYFQGVAEDTAAVITVGQEQVEVPFGYLNKKVLMTRDLVPTEPKAQELKFYAPVSDRCSVCTPTALYRRKGAGAYGSAKGAGSEMGVWIKLTLTAYVAANVRFMLADMLGGREHFKNARQRSTTS
jgi:hypothetical protein